MEAKNNPAALWHEYGIFSGRSVVRFIDQSLAMFGHYFVYVFIREIRLIWKTSNLEDVEVSAV